MLIRYPFKHPVQKMINLLKILDPIVLICLDAPKQIFHGLHKQQEQHKGAGGDQGFFTSALVGAGLGIGLSAYLTRDWDDDDEDVQRRRGLQGISLVPGDAIAPIAGERQGGLGVSASWAW